MAPANLPSGLGLLAYIVRLYARSLDCRNYDVRGHPPFADYVSGVLWEAERVDGIIGKLRIYPAELPKLKKRFPPREHEANERRSKKPSGRIW